MENICCSLAFHKIEVRYFGIHHEKDEHCNCPWFMKVVIQQGKYFTMKERGEAWKTASVNINFIIILDDSAYKNKVPMFSYISWFMWWWTSGMASKNLYEKETPKRTHDNYPYFSKLVVCQQNKWFSKTLVNGICRYNSYINFNLLGFLV